MKILGEFFASPAADRGRRSDAQGAKKNSVEICVETGRGLAARDVNFGERHYWGSFSVMSIGNHYILCYIFKDPPTYRGCPRAF